MLLPIVTARVGVATFALADPTPPTRNGLARTLSLLLISLSHINIGVLMSLGSLGTSLQLGTPYFDNFAGFS